MPLSKSLAAQSAATRLISDDGRTGFILLRLLEEDKQSFAQNDESIKVLRQLTAEVRSRHAGTKIGLTGLPIIEHDEMQSSEKSMSAATFLSFAGVLAVIIVAFGGFRHGVMAMTALVVGMIWACGCVALTIGHVNVLSIAFGSILFGLGIDYGIYYVARYLQLRRDTESTSRRLGGDGRQHGAGRFDGGVDLGDRLFCRRFHRVSRRGPTRRDRRRRRAALLACPDDGAAGDDPAGRCRRRDEEPARAAESSVLAAAAVRLSAADAVGGRRLHGGHGGRRALSLVRLQSAEPAAGGAGERRAGAQALQANQPQRVVCAVDCRHARGSAREAKGVSEAGVGRAGGGRRVETALRLPSGSSRSSNGSTRSWRTFRRKCRRFRSRRWPISTGCWPRRRRCCCRCRKRRRRPTVLRQLREMLRSIPPEEYERRVREYQQGMAADLLGRLRTLQAASTPELPRGERFAGERGLAFCRPVGPLPDAGLQQGEHLGSRADGAIRQGRAEGGSRGHRQSAASLRGLVADEAELRGGRLSTPC